VPDEGLIDYTTINSKVCKSRNNVYKFDTITVLGYDILGDISFTET